MVITILLIQSDCTFDRSRIFGGVYLFGETVVAIQVPLIYLNSTKFTQYK